MTSIPEDKRMRQHFNMDSYRNMQAFVQRIAETEDGHEIPIGNTVAARKLVESMVVPRGTTQRAKERADYLVAMANAYDVIQNLGPDYAASGSILYRALIAWEQGNPPPTLDELL